MPNDRETTHKAYANNIGVGFATSAALHGLAVLLFYFFVGLKTPLSQQSFRIMPVDVVQLGEETTSPEASRKATIPQERARPISNSMPRNLQAAKTKPRDELETKLHALAQLRASTGGTSLEENPAGASGLSTENDSVNGHSARYSLRDYLRAQVERRWNLNLQRPGVRDMTIPIRIEITNRGVVTKAEILEQTRAVSDAVYRDVAISARNAVLLSSPFALPAGIYSPTISVTLVLNPKDALH